MRQYTPIWIRLKKEKVVRVTANRALHPRIIKAVVKEKYMDLEYKIEIEPKRAILWSSSKNSILTFTLELKLDHITEKELEL